MAELIYKGAGLKPITGFGLADGKVTDFNGRSIKISPNEKLRVEVYGNVGILEASNCASIDGNVRQARIGNVLTCDGMVQSCYSDYWQGSKVSLDKNAFVFFGREADYWSAYKDNFPLSTKKATVMRINGDLERIVCSLSGIEVHLEIHGNVNMADIGNCLYVRGNVIEAKASRCRATMGVGKRPNPKALYKKRQIGMQGMFDGMFN